MVSGHWTTGRQLLFLIPHDSYIAQNLHLTVAHVNAIPRETEHLTFAETRRNAECDHRPHLSLSNFEQMSALFGCEPGRYFFRKSEQPMLFAGDSLR